MIKFDTQLQLDCYIAASTFDTLRDTLRLPDEIDKQLLLLSNLAFSYLPEDMRKLDD